MKPQTKILPLSKIEPNNGQLKGLPKNPRFIRDNKFEQLKASLQESPEMLELRELLVYPLPNGKYILIGGNMRYRALKDLGVSEAPVKIIPSEATVEQLKAYTIKDNAAFGEFDYEALANEWEEVDLTAWGVDIPETEDVKEEDEAEDDNFDVEANKPKDPITKLGDVWLMNGHRLICGDSTKRETYTKLMKGRSADLYLTDPPYNVDYSAKNEALKSIDVSKQRKSKKPIENDKMSPEAFRAFLTSAFGEANDAIKLGAPFYIWHSSAAVTDFINAANSVGWQIRQTLIWAKNNLVIGLQDYQWKHEPCLYGWKEGAGHFFTTRRDLTTILEDEQPDLDKMSKDEMKALLGKIFDLPSTIIHEAKPARNADHPTMKPVPLFGKLIKNSSRPGDVVLDNFGGSGTTLIAAEQLNRKAYLIELDPVYCDVIVRRWEELTGETAILENSTEEKN